MIMEMEQAKLRRLENCKEKQEKYRNPQEIESEEEALRKRLILAEITENAWKRRGKQSSHEEHSERLETKTKIQKKEKVKEKVDQLEKGRKLAEENEKKRKFNFMKGWKDKVERKRKQEYIQRGWKDLMESVESWEEIQEGDTENCIQEDVTNQEWTEKGFQEAGEIIENVLSEVMAFLEMIGTVKDNNYHHAVLKPTNTIL